MLQGIRTKWEPRIGATGSSLEPLNQVAQALDRSKNMSEEKEEASFSILTIYDELEKRRSEPESPGLSSQPEQLGEVYGSPQPPPGSPRQSGPAYVDVSWESPPPWAPQILDSSDLQASWLPEAELGEDAESGFR